MGRNRFYTRCWVEAGVAPGDIKSLADLRNLPFTSKMDLERAQAEAPPFGTNATFPVAPTRAFINLPAPQASRPCSIRRKAGNGGGLLGNCVQGCRVGAEDRVFLPFSFGPFIGFWAAMEEANRSEP